MAAQNTPDQPFAPPCTCHTDMPRLACPKYALADMAYASALAQFFQCAAAMMMILLIDSGHSPLSFAHMWLFIIMVVYTNWTSPIGGSPLTVARTCIYAGAATKGCQTLMAFFDLHTTLPMVTWALDKLWGVMFSVINGILGGIGVLWAYSLTRRPEADRN